MMLAWLDWQFGDYFATQTSLQEIFCTQILCTYLKVSTGVQISTLLEKNWDEALDKEIDL